MTSISASNKVAGVTEGQSLTLNSRHGVLAGDTDSSHSLSVTAVSAGGGTIGVASGSATIQGAYGTLVMRLPARFAICGGHVQREPDVGASA